MGYGQSSRSNVVKVKKVNYPKKLERKSVLSAMVIRSYAKNKNFLTDAMVKKLKEHSKHHTNKHMKQMVVQMEGGDSFANSHKKAQKKIGK